MRSGQLDSEKGVPRCISGQLRANSERGADPAVHFNRWEFSLPDRQCLWPRYRYSFSQSQCQNSGQKLDRIGHCFVR